ncbi:hypothetical protein HPB50_027736 [Hyalomma asiaticum]|nr:hypothetical protein HPB50_027736 [Hyalomma asiaticum]
MSGYNNIKTRLHLGRLSHTSLRMTKHLQVLTAMSRAVRTPATGGTGTATTTTTPVGGLEPSSTQEPRVTYDSDDNFLLPPGVSVEEFCSKQIDTVSRALPLVYSHTPVFVDSKPVIQYRHILCVFDVRHWRQEEPYTPYLLPFSYCTAIILTGYGVNGATGSLLEKDESLTTFARTLQNIQPLHGAHRTTVYVTLGGDRDDSANLSRVAAVGTARSVLIRELSSNVPQLWQVAPETFTAHMAVLGAYSSGPSTWDTYTRQPGKAHYVAVCNLDKLRTADRPECLMTSRPVDNDTLHSDGPGTINFSGLLDDILSARFSVIVSIPPIVARMRWYDLNKHLSKILYVIVKTHTLRYPDLVSCSGERTFAAQVYNDIRRMFNQSSWWKLGYSVSVAPETFTAHMAVLGAYSSGPSTWDTYTRQPGKAHYVAVCNLDKLRTADRPECLMTSRPVDNDTLHVVAFADEEALVQRMVQSYSDGMGVAPVAVYDVDLDDYRGVCSGGAVMSPLIRALASGVTDSATKIFN